MPSITTDRTGTRAGYQAEDADYIVDLQSVKVLEREVSTLALREAGKVEIELGQWSEIEEIDSSPILVHSLKGSREL
jgi:hypothetical protein